MFISRIFGRKMNNKNKKILLVGSLQHPQLDYMLKHLQSMQANVVVVEPYLLDGTHDPLTWIGNDIYWKNIDISVSQIQSVFVASRASEYPLPHVFDQQVSGQLNWESWFQEYGLQRDRSDLLLSVLLAYEKAGISMINPVSASQLSRRKPYQVSVMKSAGCLMPETLITNDVIKAREFIDQHKPVIIKPAAGGALTMNAHQLSNEHLQELKFAPAIFQQRIDGKDLRIMVLDGEIISSVIIDVPDGTLDFRGDSSYEMGTAGYTSIILPDEVSQQCIMAAKALGLRHTGIDIKLTSDNQYYFLECNSGPMYLDVEYKTGHPITSRICDRLIAG